MAISKIETASLDTGLVAPSATTATTATSLTTASGSAPSYSARAWVNFDGTGTPAIRASGNVSSITDNGVGTYTVNFTTAMPDANYAVHEQHSTGSAQTTGGGTTPQISTLHTQTTTSVQLQYSYYTGTSNTISNNDGPATWASVSVFR
jgi:hypothetical protein